MNVDRLLLAALGTLILGACSGKQEPNGPSTAYDTATVQPRDIAVTVEAAGTVQPELVVEVKSKASGEVLSLGAEVGDHVAEGALLVSIDQRTPRNNLAQAKAALAAAKARLTIARSQRDRAKTLRESGTLSQQEFEQTELEYANAQAEVVSQQVAVQNAQIAMDDTRILAPIAGTIIEKNVEVGTVISSPTRDVSGGTVLMKMADLSTVQVRALIDETDIGKIRPGMPATVTVASYPNQPFTGEIVKIEPQAVPEQSVTMFSVLISLENPNGMLLPGMTANVDIAVADEQSALAVPTLALRTDADIAAAAQMVGWQEERLRAALAGSRPGVAARDTEAGATPETMPSRDELRRLMEKRRSGAPLSAEEQQLLNRARERFARGGGRAGPGGPYAANGAEAGSGGGPPRGFSGGRRPRSSTDYQFHGAYWVFKVADGRLQPVRVITGVTDLGWSAVESGLNPGDQVLLLPSTDLFQRQERIQSFVSRRFATIPGLTNNNNPPGRPGR